MGQENKNVHEVSDKSMNDGQIDEIVNKVARTDLGKIDNSSIETANVKSKTPIWQWIVLLILIIAIAVVLYWYFFMKNKGSEPVEMIDTREVVVEQDENINTKEEETLVPNEKILIPEGYALFDTQNQAEAEEFIFPISFYYPENFSINRIKDGDNITLADQEQDKLFNVTLGTAEEAFAQFDVFTEGCDILRDDIVKLVYCNNNMFTGYTIVDKHSILLILSVLPEDLREAMSVADVFFTNLQVDATGIDCQGVNCVMEQIDTDNDGLVDDEELAWGTDLNNPDTDGDGLSDYDEVNKWQTDPNNPDSDGDTYSDGEEVSNGYNPSGEGILIDDNSYVELELRSLDSPEMSLSVFAQAFNDNDISLLIKVLSENHPDYVMANENGQVLLDFMKVYYKNQTVSFEIISSSQEENLVYAEVNTLLNGDFFEKMNMQFINIDNEWKILE